MPVSKVHGLLFSKVFSFRSNTERGWHCEAQLPSQVFQGTSPQTLPNAISSLSEIFLHKFPFSFFVNCAFFLFVNKETNKKARMQQGSARTQLINNEHWVFLIISFCLSLTNWSKTVYDLLQNNFTITLLPHWKLSNTNFTFWMGTANPIWCNVTHWKSREKYAAGSNSRISKASI